MASTTTAMLLMLSRRSACSSSALGGGVRRTSVSTTFIQKLENCSAFSSSSLFFFVRKLSSSSTSGGGSNNNNNAGESSSANGENDPSVARPLSGKNPTRERVEMAKPTPEELERIEQRRTASMEKVKQKELEQEPFVNPETGEVGGPRGPEPTRYGDWGFKGRISDF